MKDSSKKPDSKAEDKQKQNSPEVARELSQVATNPKQSSLILVGIILIFGYLFFNFVINSDADDTKKQEKKVKAPENIVTPTQGVDVDIPVIPTLPTPPKLEDLEPPLPALPEEKNTPVAQSPVDPALPGIELPPAGLPVEPSLPVARAQDDQALKQKEKKRKSSMILIAGAPPKKNADELQQEADFNYRGDMNLMLGRGKVIDAVVENALSTDFGGEVRAVVTKDVYSEWGRNILIPKGSRVLGTYSTNLDELYGRINVIWSRIDLINGYSVNISSPTIDNLGRTGQQGRLDNKFRERLGNAILRSAFNITLAKGLDKIVEPQLQSTTAATRNADATNIKNIANSIFTQPGITEAQKREQICAAVLNSLSDKTSSTFLQIQTTCQNLRTDTNSDENAKLLSLINAINSISDSLIRDTTVGTEETQAQKASKESYEEISDTIKSFVEDQNLQPTVTIDQGTAIKIYVNRDYKFPKKAVNFRRSN